MNTQIEFLDQLGADLMAAAEREATYAPAPPRRRVSVRLVASLAAATLVIAGVVDYLVPRLSSPTEIGAAISRPAPNIAVHVPSAGNNVAQAGIGGGSGGARAPAQTAPMPAALPAGRPYSKVSAPGGVTLVGPRIVKTASTSIVVKRGTFMQAFDQASAIAGENGGFVQSSSTGGSPARYGNLEIRVPATRFTQTLSELQRLGSVESQSVSGEDVTARYVDLQARIRTWRSQEQALLLLMTRATTIGQTLSIESRLQNVQLTIEQLKGQLRVLQDQTANGTISVALREPGVRTVHKEQSLNPSFGRGWDRAVAGFLGVFITVLIGLGYLIPIVAVGALVWVAGIRLRRRLLA